MPYLKVQTSALLDADTGRRLLTEASALVARELGKPERYVMVALETSVPMLFAGTDAPAAYLELKSIGLPQARTAALSQALCGLLSQYGLDPERVYIEFSDAPRASWGWNGGTF